MSPGWGQEQRIIEIDPRYVSEQQEQMRAMMKSSKIRENMKG